MPSNKVQMPIYEAVNIAMDVAARLALAGMRFMICGSIRRERDVVSDVDMVVSRPLSDVVKVLKHREGVQITETKKGGNYKFLIDGVQFDFRYAKPESWGAMVLYLTGSQLFNILIRGVAKNQGYKLNEYGLWLGEEQIAGRTEEQIFEALGLEYLKPPERELTLANRMRRWLKQKEV